LKREDPVVFVAGVVDYVWLFVKFPNKLDDG
jgi:hypothetical protein